MKRLIPLILAAVLAVMGLTPATADESRRDLVELFANAANRYKPTPVGEPVDMSYVFGPYIVPPGQDSNRTTIDIPIKTGFAVAVAPDLVDATDGRIPTQQEAHIHHAHWFRVTNDPEHEYYTQVQGNGLSWVFGTGEEKTQGRLEDRARLAPENNDTDPNNDFTYGIPVDGETPQALIFMIHNKLATVGRYYVVLDVTFIPGSRAEIQAATGKDIRPVYGQLWGQTKSVTGSSKGIGARWTVTRDGTAVAMGSHLHPGGKATVVSNLGPMVGAGSSRRPLCQGTDPDGDGFDGIALLHSYKYDRDMNVWPYSENYQMGVTKFGWRAPVRAGDVLEQRAPYALDASSQFSVFGTQSHDGLAHNWYEAMTYTGIYMEREQVPTGPPPLACTVAAFQAAGQMPYLLGNDTFEDQGLSVRFVEDGERKDGVQDIEDAYNFFLPSNPTQHQRTIQGMVNHIWQVREPLCAQPGLNLSGAAYPPCGPSDIATQRGPEVTEIHVAGFAYVPGDLNRNFSTPVIPAVRRGSTLTFVNEDAALNIRHTFTSCEWPCTGRYVSNFPLPSGGPLAFDTGKIGNIDPVDGGADYNGVARWMFGADPTAWRPGDPLFEGPQSDTVPFYSMTVDLPAGRYSYFCRIHPDMRGAFEVVE